MGKIGIRVKESKGGFKTRPYIGIMVLENVGVIPLHSLSTGYYWLWRNVFDETPDGLMFKRT
jgi:hypothetical protein